ncbi:uncharacterized protein LOC119173804 isoform X1 [Rhipicephalus microplus]|uniref:uncharacterized protein LOC119173804 isoform X1 n=1 Tax=Rhipicephalus microplus TaxID=6941 RepID=UPI003F6ABD2C
MQAFFANILPWLSICSAGLAHVGAPLPTMNLVSVADQHMPSSDAPWVLFEDPPAPSTTAAIATDSFKKQHLDTAFSGHESSGLCTALSRYFFTMQAFFANILPWLSICSAGLAHVGAPLPTMNLVSVADQHMPSSDAPWVLFEDPPAPSTTAAIATDSFKKQHLDTAFSGHESSGLCTALSRYFFTMQARREDETACDSDDEGEEESTEKSSESGIGDEEKGESDEEEMEEATDYVHNYYDDFEDDGAFIEDNFDDATFF